MNFEEIKALDQTHIMHTYGRNDVCIVSGKGSRCTDINGKDYNDFTTGIGVNSLGFCDESWVSDVAEQAGKLQHVSNLY